MLVDRRCVECGEAYQVERYKAGRRRFCSPECNLIDLNRRRIARAKERERDRTSSSAPDNKWKALLNGSEYESVSVKRSLIPHIERMPENAREI